MIIGVTFTEREAMRKELTRRGVQLSDDSLEEFDKIKVIDAIVDVLGELGHSVRRLGWGTEMLQWLASNDPPDLVFNVAEGLGGRGREAQVPAVMEMLQIPFVGSDATALGIALDKSLTKAVVAAAGVRVAKHFLVKDRPKAWDDLYSQMSAHGLDWPVVVKPNDEGSSIGVTKDSVVRCSEDLFVQTVQLFDRSVEPVMVEEFVRGDEVTVAVIGDPPQVLGMALIRPIPGHDWEVYSLDLKRSCEVEYVCPPSFLHSTIRRVEDSALRAFEALGCKDMARIDFRVKPDGEPVFLEINPLPGLAPGYSDLVFIADAYKVPYAEVMRRIVDGAVKRYQLR